MSLIKELIIIILKIIYKLQTVYRIEMKFIKENKSTEVLLKISGKDHQPMGNYNKAQIREIKVTVQILQSKIKEFHKILSI